MSLTSPLPHPHQYDTITVLRFLKSCLSYQTKTILAFHTQILRLLICVILWLKTSLKLTQSTFLLPCATSPQSLRSILASHPSFPLPKTRTLPQTVPVDNAVTLLSYGTLFYSIDLQEFKRYLRRLLLFQFSRLT